MKLNVYKSQNLLYSIEIETFDMKDGAEFFIGRNEDCHIVLDDKRVSRYHTKIFIHDGIVAAKNVSQEGGLRINGVDEKAEKELEDGDRITIFEWCVEISSLETFQGRFFQKELKAPLKSDDQGFDPGPMNDAFNDTIFKDLDQPKANNEEKTRLTSVLKTDIFKEDELNLLEGSVDNNNDEFGSDNNNFESNDFSQEDDIGNDLYEEEDNQDLNDEFSRDESNDFNADGDNFEQESFSENTEAGEDGFGFNDFGGDGGFGDEDATNIIQSFLKIELFLKGPHATVDRFVLTEKETFVGRNKDCQIILNDELVSEKHAVFKKVHNFLVLEDLNSSNGTYVDKFRINKQELRGNEIVEIGSTVITLRFSSEMLKNEKDTLLPVEKEMVEEREEIIEEFVDEAEEGSGGKQSLKDKLVAVWRNPQKRKPVLYAVVLLTILLVLFGEDEQTTTETKVVKKEEVKKEKKDPKKRQFTEQELAELDSAYNLGITNFDNQTYDEALKQFDFVHSRDPEYQMVSSYLVRTKAALKKIKEGEEKRRKEEEFEKLRLELAEFIKKANDALAEDNLELAETFADKVLERDPENIEAQNIKLQIKGKRAKIAEEEAKKRRIKDERQRQLDLLNPGKQYYLKEKWYQAIVKLEEFLDLKGMDEDLVKEASDMLGKSKENLDNLIKPLLSKAKSYLDGQDLKMAYDIYSEILKYNPNQIEALNKINEIFEKLERRSKRIYREALVSESLSLFDEAKEKFEEVRQISPTGSNYYNKATNKLKNYLE